MDGAAKFAAAALALRATYPWSIIPIRNDSQGHKKAACPWKEYRTRRPSIDETKRLFSMGGLTGLAAVLGAASASLYGRDFDVLEAYHRWAAHYPDLAQVLPTVKTARGRHVYGYSPDEVQTKDLGDGELRGEASYILLPPSLHPSGTSHTWVCLPRHPCSETIIAPDAAGLSRSWLSDTDLTPTEQRDRETENPRTGELEGVKGDSA